MKHTCPKCSAQVNNLYHKLIRMKGVWVCKKCLGKTVDKQSAFGCNQEYN